MTAPKTEMPVVRVPWDVFEALEDTVRDMTLPTISYGWNREQDGQSLVLWGRQDGARLMIVPCDVAA